MSDVKEQKSVEIPKDFLELRTTDHFRVFFKKDQIAAIEEVPKGARSEGQVKVYAAGFSFTIQESLEKVMQGLI